MRLLADRRLQHERRARAAVEQELAKFRAYCTAQEREITSLHAALRRHGISISEDVAMARSLVPAATISVVAEVNSCTAGADISGLSFGVSDHLDPPSNDLSV